MASFLALLAFLQAAGVHVERVTVPGPNGVNLDAVLVLPEGTAKAPAVVALQSTNDMARRRQNFRPGRSLLTGVNFHLDWGASQFLSEYWHVGVVGQARILLLG
jgi:hypothetical protein